MSYCYKSSHVNRGVGCGGDMFLQTASSSRKPIVVQLSSTTHAPADESYIFYSVAYYTYSILYYTYIRRRPSHVMSIYLSFHTSLHIYIYIYIFLCLNIYIYIHVCIYIFICRSIHLHLDISRWSGSGRHVLAHRVEQEEADGRVVVIHHARSTCSMSVLILLYSI